MYNCVEYVIVVYAMLSVGGIVTTSNPAYTPGNSCKNNIGDKMLVTIILYGLLIEDAVKLQHIS